MILSVFGVIGIPSGPTFAPASQLLALQLVRQQLLHLGQRLLLLVQLAQARVRHGHHLGLEDGLDLATAGGSVVEPHEALALPHRVREVALRAGALAVAEVQDLDSVTGSFVKRSNNRGVIQ